MAKVAVIAFSNLKTDPRVYRQITFLRGKYQVLAIGYDDPEIEGVQFFDCRPRYSLGTTIVIRLRRYLARRVTRLFRHLCLIMRLHRLYIFSLDHVKNALVIAKKLEVDLVIANDIETLPVAFSGFNTERIIYDAHEYSPRELENILWWRCLKQPLNTYLCRKYLPQVKGMTTVCESIRKEYKKTFKVNARVLTNAPHYENLEPSPPAAIVRLIHHGASIPSRKIEKMIKMLDFLDDRFELSLMLMPTNRNYLKQLKAAAVSNRRVKFLDPVPMHTLPVYLNQFDIGVFLLEPVNFNYRFALPNKLFEFIQARLVVATGPSPEMAAVVSQHQCGVVSDTFEPEDLAHELNKLTTDKIVDLKANANKAAALFSADNNQKIMLDLCRDVLNEK